MQHRKITFIGAGNMARAIIAGLVAGGYPAKSISVCAPSAKNRDALAADYGIVSSGDNVACAREAEVVVLAVKPQMMADVCQPLREQVDFGGKLVLSIAAGIQVSRFYQLLGLPLNMDGTEQPVTAQARKFANRLHGRFGIQIDLHDERLSTVEARANLFDRGGFRALDKGSVDSASAVVILESWFERQLG